MSHDRLRRQLTAHGPKEGLGLNAMHINISQYMRWMLAMTVRLLVWLLSMQCMGKLLPEHTLAYEPWLLARRLLEPYRGSSVTESSDKCLY